MYKLHFVYSHCSYGDHNTAMHLVFSLHWSYGYRQFSRYLSFLLVPSPHITNPLFKGFFVFLSLPFSPLFSSFHGLSFTPVSSHFCTFHGLLFTPFSSFFSLSFFSFQVSFMTLRVLIPLANNKWHLYPLQDTFNWIPPSVEVLHHS